MNIFSKRKLSQLTLKRVNLAETIALHDGISENVICNESLCIGLTEFHKKILHP